MKLSFEQPEFKLLDIIDKMHLTGENAFETLKRAVIQEALYLTDGSQIKAAKLLGISPRRINYAAKDLSIRPKDQRRRNESILAGSKKSIP